MNSMHYLHGKISMHLSKRLTKESMAVFAILPETIQQQLVVPRKRPTWKRTGFTNESEKLFSLL